MSDTETGAPGIELPDMPDAPRDGSGLRTYEVYQRQRVRDATPLIKPRQLTSSEYLEDPYPVVGILREHYPCYRDWPGNSFWITRYDDVTSVLVDDANYESRPKRWFYGLGEWGRDFGDDVPVRWAVANTLDGNARPIAERIVGDLRELGRATDLASEFAFRFAMEMLAATFDVPQ